MNAKQIVNRLLEDYDPDLDPTSPESVSASIPTYPEGWVVKTENPLPDWAYKAVTEVIDGHLNPGSDSDEGEDIIYIGDGGDKDTYYLEAVTTFPDEEDDRNNVEEFYIYKNLEVAEGDNRFFDGNPFELEDGAWALNYHM